MRKILLLFIYLSLNLYSQYVWNKVPSPEGGSVGAIYKTGDTLLAGLNNTIYFSTNDGVCWQKSTLNFIYNAHSFHHISGGPFYAFTNGGVYMSTDLINWTYKFGNSLSHAFAIDPEGNYYLSSSYSVKKSTNKGTTWSDIFIIPNSYFSYLFITDNYIFVSAKSAVYRKSLSRTDEWKKIEMSQYRNPITLQKDNNILYSYCEYNPLVLLSNDLGNTWEEINLEESVPGIKPTDVLIDKNVMLVANDLWQNKNLESLYRSNNFGKRLEPARFGIPEKISINRILKDEGNYFISTYGSGIIKSKNKGRSWFPLNTGINEVFVNSIVSLDPSTLLISTYGAGIFKSTDRGHLWRSANAGLPDRQHLNLVRNSYGVLFVSNRFGIFKSSNAGEKWTKLTTPNEEWDYKLFVDKNDHLYAIYYRMVYFSSDEGITWNQIYYGEDPMGIILNNKGHLFLTTLNPQKILKTTNMGQSWNTIFTFNGCFLEPMSAANGILFFPSLNGLIKSTDNGNTFTNSSSGMTNLYLNGTFTDNHDNYFTSAQRNTSLAELYYSCNEGNSWSVVTGNLYNTTVNDMFFFNDRILLATDHGLWSSSSNELAKETIEKDAVIHLQNYPNPFNNSTIIKYNIPVDGYISLRVYDILGRETISLVDGFKQSGDYELSFNADNLASGIYFYVLRQNSLSQIKKMIILK